MPWIMGESPEEPIDVPEGTPGSIPGVTPGPTTEYIKWLALSLSAYEKVAMTLIKHRPEKGRIVESVVKSALRTILPDRFSIGTGFAMTSSGRTSSQLDLVIFDGFCNSPIVLEGGTSVFPIECVYGFVEVKSVLNGDAIESFTQTVQSVRDLADEKRFVVYGTQEDGKGNVITREREVSIRLPPRSFMFAIKSEYSNIDRVEAALKEYTMKNRSHVHGLAVLDRDWFLRQVPYTDPHEFMCKVTQSLAEFCAAVLGSIQSITMRPAAMKHYLGSE